MGNASINEKPQREGTFLRLVRWLPLQRKIKEPLRQTAQSRSPIGRRHQWPQPWCVPTPIWTRTCPHPPDPHRPFTSRSVLNTECLDVSLWFICRPDGLSAGWQMVLAAASTCCKWHSWRSELWRDKESPRLGCSDLDLHVWVWVKWTQWLCPNWNSTPRFAVRLINRSLLGNNIQQLDCEEPSSVFCFLFFFWQPNLLLSGLSAREGKMWTNPIFLSLCGFTSLSLRFN